MGEARRKKSLGGLRSKGARQLFMGQVWGLLTCYRLVLWFQVLHFQTMVIPRKQVKSQAKIIVLRRRHEADFS